MKIHTEHLIFIWESNGPDRYQVLKKVIETENNRYFIVNSNGSFDSIGNVEFERYKKETLDMIFNVNVKSSQPRERR